MKHRVIAINLPQYHPFKENDEWWGKGFTEWTNVTKAKPRFKGHYQPHLPTETGFYDLRLPEVRQMQADMAREAGIYGFCYYHYWFNGHQLMERPVNEILASGKPDFPFMLCWANENWARNWDGGFKNVLMEQHYSLEDDKAHIRWLCKNVFPDKRYIKVDGKPVFSIYRPFEFPNLKRTVEIWRETALREFGMELYLMHADVPCQNYPDNPLNYGMNASFDFQPVTVITTKAGKYDFLKKNISWKIPYIRYRPWFRNFMDRIPDLYSYKKYVKRLISQPFHPHRYPCASPGFDNSPRRVGRSYICFSDSTPELYERWLRHYIENFQPFSKEENFIFINAWNEWAEGNHLEPDMKWGRGYLNATRNAINKSK